MSCKSGLLLMILLGVIWGSSTVLAATAPFDTNLIVQGHAESDVGSATGETIDPVSSMDRNEVTGLSFAIVTGMVPAGTRSREIALALTRLEGTHTDGYLDTLSLKLITVPLPPAFVLFGGGLSILPWALWWQRHVKRA